VTNSSGTAGKYNLTLKINGRLEQLRMVGIDAGTARPVAFVVHRSQPGTYSVGIDGEQGRFSIVGARGKR